MTDVLIDPELPDDADAIRVLNDAAFGQGTEGAIVDALRSASSLTISLVARIGDLVVGHAAFSPVATESPGALVLGLGPVAVTPSEQRRGIGTALVRAGIERVREAGWHGVVVLGHPEYYPRFGFVPASRFGIRCEYDVPDDVFMALELRTDGLRNCAGLARYHAAFALAAP